MAAEAALVKCPKLDATEWRTPNEWWFVAVCQACGRCATSMADGGAALAKLRRLHGEEEQ